jgi:hypothetical protein
MSEVKTDKLSPRTASGTVTLGTSGDTFTVPSGVTLTNSGTASGFGDEAQYFFARMTGSNQNVNDNTSTKVNINSEVLDNKSIFDTTNNKLVITAATAGIWLIGAQVAGNNTQNSALQKVFAMLYKNGSSLGDAYDSLSDLDAANGLGFTTRSVSAIVSLASADYVELYALVARGTGSAQNEVLQRGTNFYGHRVKAA